MAPAAAATPHPTAAWISAGWIFGSLGTPPGIAKGGGEIRVLITIQTATSLFWHVWLVPHAPATVLMILLPCSIRSWTHTMYPFVRFLKEPYESSHLQLVKAILDSDSIVPMTVG
ncbi:hypothetical protein DY000_02013341 [Brassica cretica]|uniref:HVA22-like protein n=1 Tax=Brassica cretica TaxID=69181 RepID=A0ABQ7CYA0_BRACR|nr:hypothetical protein DY000_02013341 [Brassica cretica]